VTDGVGIDLEELDALARFTGRADHLACRWLDGAERAWCRAQGHPARAFVVVWSCREAVFKAGTGAAAPGDIRLTLAGTLERGRARAYLQDRLVAAVAWRLAAGHVLAVAADPVHAEAGLLDRLLSLAPQEDVNADSGYGRHRLHRHGTGPAPA
jgi:phosphopantetheinyl transferase (holo-ACP synthase)